MAYFCWTCGNEQHFDVKVGVKVGRRGGRVYNAQPEFEDCQRAASQGGVPLKEVWAAALAAYRGART